MIRPFLQKDGGSKIRFVVAMVWEEQLIFHKYSDCDFYKGIRILIILCVETIFYDESDVLLR